MDLPRALALLARTALVRTLGYRVIRLEDLVEAGLRPLASHAASTKILVNLTGSEY